MCCGMVLTGEKRPTSNVKVNNTVINCLWDTGADLCAMSTRTAKRLAIKPKIRPYYNTLTAANGQEIRSQGIARVKFDLGNNIEFEHDVVVLDQLKSDLILGVDLMHKQGLIIDLQNKRITRGKRMDAPVSACSPKAFSLEPLQAMTVEVLTPKHSTVGQTYLASGLNVPQGIVENNHCGKTKILVVNKNVTPIQIKRGEELCTLETVNNRDMLKNDELCRRAEKEIYLRGGGETIYENKVK